MATLITNFSTFFGNSIYTCIYLRFVSRHSFVFFSFVFPILCHPVYKIENMKYRVIYEYVVPVLRKRLEWLLKCLAVESQKKTQFWKFRLAEQVPWTAGNLS
jgi:hypothetical protein